MAFEGLTEKLSSAFKKLRGKGRLSEQDVKDAMKEIRMALLEADVSYKVVKEFTKTVTERAIGSDVLESLTPAQMIVKIVNEELTALMGGESVKLNLSSKPPTVVMVVGLNGAGKTTNCAKLAGFMKKQNGKRPLLAACDTFRPAAIHQLEVVGGSWTSPSFRWGSPTPWTSPRPPSSTPESMATIWSFWTPPAASTWTRSSWRSSGHEGGGGPRRDPPGGGRHDRPGRGERRQGLR